MTTHLVEREGVVRAVGDRCPHALLAVPGSRDVFVPRRVVEPWSWPLMVGQPVKFIINVEAARRPGMRPEALRCWRVAPPAQVWPRP